MEEVKKDKKEKGEGIMEVETENKDPVDSPGNKLLDIVDGEKPEEREKNRRSLKKVS